VLATAGDEREFTASGVVRAQSAPLALAFLISVAVITLGTGIAALVALPGGVLVFIVICLVVMYLLARRDWLVAWQIWQMLLRWFGREVAPGVWSVRVTPDRIELTQAGT
jgi:hypothetical protein